MTERAEPDLTEQAYENELARLERGRDQALRAYGRAIDQRVQANYQVERAEEDLLEASRALARHIGLIPTSDEGGSGPLP